MGSGAGVLSPLAEGGTASVGFEGGTTSFASDGGGGAVLDLVLELPQALNMKIESTTVNA